VQYETPGGYEVYRAEEYDRVIDQLPYLNGLLEDAVETQNVFREVALPSGISGFTRAIYNPLEGQLHPGFMMKFLTRKYLAMGGNIATGINIEFIDDQDDRVILRSSLSIPVETKKVIVTTNAFARQLLPDLDVHGARNHVLVTSPLSGLSWSGCYHFDKGFYYFRSIGERILLGGARNQDLEKENTEEFGRNEKIVEELERFLFTHLASAEMCRIEYQWSGIIGIGKQKRPILKQYSRGVWVGVRLSGMGIALASLIGEQLAEMVLQQEG
jgi:glycine/D-amino acid oxidase-like deaminating enzyme